MMLAKPQPLPAWHTPGSAAAPQDEPGSPAAAAGCKGAKPGREKKQTSKAREAPQRAPRFLPAASR